MKKMFLFLLLAIGCLGAVMAVEPEGYYDRALKKRRYELRDSLCAIIKKHVMRKYDQLWDDYGKTDADADSNIIDMYNSCPFKFKVHQCKGGFHGNKDNMCVCYNREHSFPKSWFGANEKAPMYTDLFHLYPVSGYVNSIRNDNALGEVSKPTFVSSNGSKLGPCSFPGYTKVVFEPIDEYKGDLARSYFYMVTCYQDSLATWKTDMLDNTSRDLFSAWSKELLLKWHRLDPVSQKELKRNEAVYAIQKNRNPFIDHPELVEKIWGNDTLGFGETVEVSDPFWNTCKLSVREGDLQIDYTDLLDAVEIFTINGNRLFHAVVRQNKFTYPLPSSGGFIVRVSVGKQQYTQKISVP